MNTTNSNGHCGGFSAVPSASEEALDVVVVGAGFSGLYALHKFRDKLGMKVHVYEKGTGIGGTWFWNRYPGARCDVPSFVYSYSFDPELDREWAWSEKYAAQPEIGRYLNYVADKFDLRRDITLGVRVVGATYNTCDNRWTIRLDDGRQVAARYLCPLQGY